MSIFYNFQIIRALVKIFIMKFSLICGKIESMHKTFYASGFIYHLPTQQILLQQHKASSSATFPWLLFESEHTEKEQPEKVFEKTISKLLGITLKEVNQIYSYLDEETQKNYSLVYAIVDDLSEFPPKKDYIFQWFPFKEVLKLPASAQTKHDIVVGQRVIEAAGRKERGEHTFQ